MFEQAIKVYKKFYSYIILFLLLCNFLTFFSPNLFLNFFLLIKKFAPSGLIEYFSSRNITFEEIFNSYSLLISLTGLSALWFFSYHFFIKHHIRDRHDENFLYHMDKIYFFLLCLSTNITLLLTLFVNTFSLSYQRIFDQIQSYNLNDKFFLFTGLAVIISFCFIIIYTYLTIGEYKKHEEL